MENSLELKKWISTNMPSDFKLKQLVWHKKYNLPIYDYMVEVNVGHNKIIGRGTDRDEDVAICKSVSEAFERYCVYRLKLPNSNGCAAHFDEFACKSIALNELIERDCFLYKFITNDFFEKIEQIMLPVFFPEGTTLTNFVLCKEKLLVTLSRINISSKSNIIGLGVGSTIASALESSEIEALRQWTYLFESNNYKNRTYDEIVDGNIKTFNDHGDLALTKTHSDQINYIFTSSSFDSKYKIPDIGATDFFTIYSEDDIKSPFYKVPLYFVKAHNQFFQELFIGDTESHLNPKRIPMNESLNLCFHPIR